MSTPHNDLPTLHDMLDWTEELDRLSQRIRTCYTPHILGIHGDWGSGKTSFMRQLQVRLGGEIPDDGSVAHHEKCKPEKERKQLQKQTITIWFDAWRYQNEPVPVVALLQEMRRQMAGLSAIKEKAKKYGNASQPSARSTGAASHYLYLFGKFRICIWHPCRNMPLVPDSQYFPHNLPYEPHPNFRR